MNKKLLVLGLVSTLVLGVGCSSNKDVDKSIADEPAIEQEVDKEKEEVSAKENIVGKWENEDTVLEFTEDGVMKQVSNTDGVQKAEIEEVGEGVEVIGGNEDGTFDVHVKGSIDIEMEYEVVDENTINLIMMGHLIETNYEINGDTLTMEDIGELVRVK